MQYVMLYVTAINTSIKRQTLISHIVTMKVIRGINMTVKELKEVLKLQHGDNVTYRRNDEKVTAKQDDHVVAVEASGDWDGYVWYTVTVE